MASSPLAMQQTLVAAWRTATIPAAPALDTLMANAEAEGVLPLLAARWQAAGALPAGVAQRYYSAIAPSLLCYSALPAVLQALAGVTPVIVLKGAALGTTLYSDPALRPLHDLDLLVTAARCDAAVSALVALGYRAIPLVGAAAAAVEYHRRLEHPALRTVIELHWTLVAGTADLRSPDVAWFWSQTEPWRPRTNPSGLSSPAITLQLNPSAQLLHLAAHVALQHGGAALRLIWLYDLHLLISARGAELDWPLIAAAARQFGWLAAVIQALRATVELWGTALAPEGAALLALPLPAVASPRSPLAREWQKFWAVPAPVRWRWLLRTLVPSIAYLRWRYEIGSGWAVPAFYGYHWLRLLVVLGRALGRGLTGRSWQPEYTLHKPTRRP